MVQGYTAQDSGGGCARTSFPGRNRQAQRGRTKTERRNVGGSAYIVGPAREQRPASAPGESKLRSVETSHRETGGLMLSVNELGRFYYLRNLIYNYLTICK